MRQRPQHAHHRGDADPAGDHHQPGGAPQVESERAVRTVDPHRATRPQQPKLAGEIATVADGELGPQA